MESLRLLSELSTGIKERRKRKSCNRYISDIHQAYFVSLEITQQLGAFWPVCLGHVIATWIYKWKKLLVLCLS